jgi:hypothetical protein
LEGCSAKGYWLPSHAIRLSAAIKGSKNKMTSSWVLKSVRNWWLCLLFGILSWGQMANPNSMSSTQESAVTTAASQATAENRSQQATASNVEPDAPVITINGLCDKPPKGKATASGCKTVITRARFETVIGVVQPNMSTRARREFATRYADALVMAERAEKRGLDKGVNFEEQMQLARIQVLSQELHKAIQREASQISDEDIEDYYRKNTSSFEQVEMDRIYIPKTQERPAPSDNKVSEDDQQNQLRRPEQLMRQAADSLHARAIAGEDFQTLQADAYKIAGIKAVVSPSTGKIRRISLPPNQVSVMELKPGEVSSIVVDQNGYFIFKAKTKGILPLNLVREEIKGTLRSLRLQDQMQAIEESATFTLDKDYFGRNGPPPEMMRSGEPTNVGSRPPQSSKRD